MFRAVTARLGSAVSTAVRSNIQGPCAVMAVRHKHGHEESAEELDARYEAFFKRPDIDGWDVRRAMNDLQGMDMVPEPRIIVSAMHACRRVNDYALAIRYLEAVKNKCGSHVGKIWPYLLKEIKPTLDELSISTPEELGYDKPELAMQDVYDIH